MADENIYLKIMRMIEDYHYHGCNLRTVKLTPVQYDDFIEGYEKACMGMFHEFHPDGQVKNLRHLGHEVEIEVRKIC